jgi:hypothetical protein
LNKHFFSLYQLEGVDTSPSDEREKYPLYFSQKRIIECFFDLKDAHLLFFLFQDGVHKEKLL